MLFSFVSSFVLKNRKCICLSVTYNNTYKPLMQA
nr:MAG TPA: hypothetical protein [Caudoviricetes sp.]